MGARVNNVKGGSASLAAHCVVEPPNDAWDVLLKAVIVLSLVALLAMCIHAAIFSPLVRIAQRHGLLALLIKPSVIWFGMGALLLTFRTLLWFSYRPFAPLQPGSAPTMTVVIPAFNEGAMVAQAIDSVATARYPVGRLQVIVVDDGARDDTWVHIQTGRRAPSR